MNFANGKSLQFSLGYSSSPSYKSIKNLLATLKDDNIPKVREEKNPIYTASKTICAFANVLDNWGGGYIVIAVEEDNGRPVYPLKDVSVDKHDACQKASLRL
ncbi:MAG: hypothetical protein SOU16_11005 [Faecalimonas sp.]|nr:hypothetical protein [Faecalimonas sp.]